MLDLINLDMRIWVCGLPPSLESALAVPQIRASTQIQKPDSSLLPSRTEELLQKGYSPWKYSKTLGHIFSSSDFLSKWLYQKGEQAPFFLSFIFTETSFGKSWKLLISKKYFTYLHSTHCLPPQAFNFFLWHLVSGLVLVPWDPNLGSERVGWSLTILHSGKRRCPKIHWLFLINWEFTQSHQFLFWLTLRP